MLDKTFSIAIVFLVLIISCKGQKSPIEKPAIAEPMQLILEDNYSGFETEETLVVRNQKSLEKFFGKINRTRKPGLPVPDIDFSKNMLFIWCGGNRSEVLPNLSLIKETSDSYIVKKQPVKFNANSASINPLAIYMLPVSEKKIVFQ